MATTGGGDFDLSFRHLRMLMAWQRLQTFRPLAISNDPQVQGIDATVFRTPRTT
jgi:hypothetical protein